MSGIKFAQARSPDEQPLELGELEQLTWPGIERCLRSSLELAEGLGVEDELQTPVQPPLASGALGVGWLGCEGRGSACSSEVWNVTERFYAATLTTCEMRTVTLCYYKKQK